MLSTLRHRALGRLLIAGCAGLSLISTAAQAQTSKVVHFPFTVVNGFADSEDPRFYTDWVYNDEFIKAMSADPDPVIAANKRAMMGFEAALGRAVLEGKIDSDVDAIIAQYTTTDYHQMDPNIPDGRAGLSAWLKAGGMHKGGATENPPPPIAIVADRNAVSMILKVAPAPGPDDPTKLYPTYMISVFRLRDGRLTTHYSSTSRGAYWCRIDCGSSAH
jgi:predicted SnoaL-like aldol condensation-catalyzing enzyme